MPKEEAENIFRKNITQDIANKERRGIENGIFDNVKNSFTETSQDLTKKRRIQQRFFALII
ncbi:MAG: hypothetical protein ACLUGO_08915 [Mediterraneibacter faecis]